MTFANPFTAEGKWYKGNIHSHTAHSDGKLSTKEICRVYSKAGYDFLCITDHNVITENVEAADITLIRGAEINIGDIHIIGLNLKQVFNAEDMEPQEIIDEMRRQGAIPIIAHPYWSAIAAQKMIKWKRYAGIEIYNGISQKITGKGFATVHFDEILQAGINVFGTAADDTHEETDAGRGFVMVKAKSSREKDLLKSLKNGLFYSSTGIKVEDFQIDGDLIKIRCSPAASIDFIGYGNTGTRIEGADIRNAAYAIKGHERYLRVEITGENNEKAWLNPLFLPKPYAIPFGENRLKAALPFLPEV